MTAEQYKKKLITYLEHHIKLCECNKAVEKDKFEHYSKDENFDFQKIINSRAKMFGAEQRVAQLKNLIADIKDGSIELIMEEK